MNSVEVVANFIGIETLNKRITNAPASAAKFFTASVLKSVFISDLFQLLTKNPNAPQYPLTWASDKQRRFVMAKLRRENNLPYRRSSKLRTSWEVIAIYGNAQAELRAVNDTPYVNYVMGIYKQPMFPQWQDAPPLIKAYGSLAAAQMADGWQQIGQGK